jgi:para-nitrobenzyl esterase
VGPRLETRSGWVEGRREEGLAVFRGVPYARAPRGALRFAPPAREAAWAGVRAAADFAAAAPQRPSALMRLLGMHELAQDEDCLYLNAWTPCDPSHGGDGDRRPVLVWLHGGAFVAGAGSLEAFDGAGLARRGDAVVVTANYRLGAAGFLVLPDLLHAGEVGANFGLLDQLAVLAWVREHAARLGGDPDRVTVFGESAGAMSIGALLGAPEARGLVRRAVLQSGAAHNVSSLEDGLRVTSLFRAALGLPHAEAAALRALPLEVLLDAQQRVIAESHRHVEGLPFQPVVDGVTLPRPPLDAVAEGAVRDVSLLVGTNLDEWNLFALADAKLAGLDAAGLARRLARGAPRAASDPHEFAARALEVYRGARAGDAASPRALWLALQSDRAFRIPAIRLLERQVAGRADPAPAFAYLFTWPSPAMGGALGACHAIEVPFVFGTHRGRAGELVGRGPDADRLAARVQDAWVAFARTGDPGWAAYDPAKRATLLLGRECALESDPMREERRFWESLL